MSMLSRKGTLVRKHRTPLRKQSVRRTRSGGSTSSSAAQRTEEEDNSLPASPIARFDPSSPIARFDPASPVARFEPVSPVTRFDPRVTPKSSPSRSITGTVVSFDDQKHLFKTSVDWSQSASVDTGMGRQDAVVQIEELAKDTDSTCEFMCRVGKILCSSDLVTVLLAACMIIPVAMVSLGVKFLDDCPLEPRVPVYLLVGGCVLLLKLTLCLWRAMQRRRHDNADVTFDEGDAETGFSSRSYRFMNGVLTIFLIGWHVTGSYWLFSIWKPRFAPLLHDPSEWCERSVYLFSVGQNVGLYCLSCLYLAALCCLALIYRPPDTDIIR